MSINGNLMFLILQGISGGASGYITNKYAVNMLFKEYTPLKFGGVIRKNKQKFIEELSELIERDIINGNTLKEKISTDEFKMQLKSMCTSILTVNLRESINELKFQDISNFYECKDAFREFTKENLELLMSDFVSNFLNNFDIESILSNAQKANISNKLYNLILDTLEKEGITQELILDLYNENSNIKISEILNEDSKNKIKEEIEKYTELIIKDVFEDEESLKSFINKLCEILKIDDIIDKLQESLKEKEIGFFINSEKIENFINSNDLRIILKDIIGKIYEEFLESDKYIYEILPEETNSIIESILKVIIEKSTPYICEYVVHNKDEINKLIEESINEAMVGFDSSIKNLIINKARDTFLSDNPSKTNAVNKIVEYIENYSTNENAPKDLSEYIINYSKDIKVSDIVKNLDKEIVYEKLFMNDDSIIKVIINKLLKKKIKDVITFDLKEFLNDNGSEYIYKIIFENKINLSKKISQFICENINNKVDELYNTDLKSINFINNNIDNISKNSSKYIFELFKENEETIKKYIKSKVQTSISEINLNEEFIKNKTFVESMCIEKVLSIEDEIISKYEDSKVIDIIEKITSKEEVIEQLNEEIFTYVNNNLNIILDQKVKKIVYDNLITFNEDEICDLAQKFMGNELKPLSIFGGILGGITGLIFGLFSANINTFGFYNNSLTTVTSCLLMGIIGIMTNVIALKMLFHPYKKNKFLAKIPFLKNFALGYIPAHRESMAVGIGNVIEDNLLNASKVKSLFENKKNYLKMSLINNIEGSNYEVLSKLIAAKKETLSNSLYKRILNVLQDEKTNNDLCKSIKNTKINKIVKKTHLDNLFNNFIKQKDSIENNIINYIERKIQKEEKIKDILNDEILLKINKSIENEIYSNIKSFTFSLAKKDFIKNMLFSNDECYVNLINKSIKDFLNEEKLESINKFFEVKIEKFLKEDFKVLAGKFVEDYLTKELSNENTVADVFDGYVRLILNRNLYSISKKLNDQLVKYLSINKDEISSLVKNIISSQLNFLEKGLFLMAGGNKIVDECVDIMVSKKTPEFMNDNLYEIISVLENMLNNSLYVTEISEFNIKVEDINIPNTVNSIFDVGENIDLSKEIESISYYLCEYICNIKVDYIRSFINENCINEVHMIQEEISRNINDDLDEISRYITNMLKENIIKYIYDVKVEEIYENMNIRYTIKTILNKALDISIRKDNISSIIKNFYESNSNLTFKDFIDENVLFTDIKENLIGLSKNNEFNAENMRLINIVVENAIRNNIDFINNSAKMDLTEYFSEAMMSGAIEHTTNILKGIKLKEVTEKQISAMDPKEIHMLFDSFAGDFFKKLYLYGSFGAVFGINVYLSIILVIGDAVSEKNIKK